MISVSRVIPFEEYFAANKIAVMHSTRPRRIRYVLYMRILPVLSLVIIPTSIWLAIKSWRAPGDHGTAFGLQLGLAAYGVAILYCPLSFRRKVRKLYERQGLDQTWLVEVSEEGVHSAIPAQGDSRLEWSYFDSCAEGTEMFVMIRNTTGMFISLPKCLLTEADQEEFRSIASAHLRLIHV